MNRMITVLVFVLGGLTSLAQGSFDSIQTNRVKEHKLNLIKNWEEQIEIAKKEKDVYQEVVNTIDLISFKKNNFGYNYEVYKEAIYIEKLIDKYSDVDSINNLKPKLYFLLGQLLRDQNKLDESISYYKQSIELAERNNDEIIKNDARTMLIYVYDINGEDNKALELFKAIEKDAKETKNFKLESKINEVISHLYLSKKDYNNAFKHIRKSLLNFDSKAGLSYRYSFISNLFLKINKELDSAIIYGEKALKVAQENQLEIEEFYAHENLKEAYFKKQDYQKAYYHFDKFYELEQRQRSFDQAIQIGKLNLDREKEEARLQKAFAEERLSNQRLVIWLISGSLLLLIAGIYYIFNRLKVIRKQNKIIEQEKQRAEQSERYKEQFLANMSHEIRTPMHAISGMINAITRRNHPKYQDVYLNAMKISLDNLLVIINDVLDLSKIESGNLEISHINMDFHEVIEHVMSILKYKSEEKGIILKSTIQDNFPKVILGDPVRLNQILMNLVGNAIKFTDSGFVEIKLSRDNNKIKVSVIDSGIGISQDQLSTIFDSFKQGSNISKSRYGGTGLGLTITKQLIELQNGKIWAESEEGVGSTFSFELPLIISEDTQEVQSTFTDTQLIALGKELKELKILIAEDNEFNIMVVKDDLNWYIPKVNITVVENGKLAVEAFSKEVFDVILMDVQMPEMNGYQATKAIRSKEEETRIPIIAMTASLLKNQIDKCYNAGMNGYIPKPYKPEQLVSTTL